MDNRKLCKTKGGRNPVALVELVIGGTLVLLGVGLGVWGTLYIQRWTLNHSVPRTLEREPVQYDSKSNMEQFPLFEAHIASGEVLLPEYRADDEL